MLDDILYLDGSSRAKGMKKLIRISSNVAISNL